MLKVFKNEDKIFHEKWTDDRKPLNIPHPFRACLFGPPNTGKSNTAKNLLAHQSPDFERCIVVHCDPEFTKEYDDIGDFELIGHIPYMDDFDGELKTLIIMDDLDFKSLKNTKKDDSRKRLSRLFGNWSTHKNISIILCSQCFYDIPPIVRRCSNLWVVWKTPDIRALDSMDKNLGFTYGTLNNYFRKNAKEIHDSIWIDKTSKTPYPLRFNGTHELL